MTDVPEISPKLAANIDRRIRERGYLTITEFATKCGVTAQGLLPLRKGEIHAYQSRLTTPVCRALGWTDDSIDRMIAGDDPIEVSSVVPDDLRAAVNAIQEEVEALRLEVARLAGGGQPPSPSADPPARARH